MKMDLKTLVGTASLAALLATPALAEGLSGNAAVTNNYMWRGVSQSSNRVAVSGGLDYDFGNGLAIGTWASSIDFDDGITGAWSHSPLELDIYGSYTLAVSDSFSLNVGGIGYIYPNQAPKWAYGSYNFWEVFGGASLGLGESLNNASLSAKVYYSPDIFGFSNEDSVYFTGGLSLPITDWLSASANVGHYTFSGATPDYTDWNIGLAATYSFATLGVQYVGSNCNIFSFTGKQLCGDKFVASLTIKVSE